MNLEHVHQDVILNNRRLKYLPAVRYEILVVAHEVRIIPFDAEAQQPQQLLYQKLSLAQCLILAQIVIVFRPRLLEQSQIRLAFRVERVSLRATLLLVDGFVTVNLRLHPNDVYLLLQLLYDQIELLGIIKTLLASQNVLEQLAGSALRRKSQRIHLSFHVVLYRYDCDYLRQNLREYCLVHLPQSDLRDVHHEVNELTQKFLTSQEVVFGEALFYCVAIFFSFAVWVQGCVSDDSHLLVLLS
jgi:hypothetical protein